MKTIESYRCREFFSPLLVWQEGGEWFMSGPCGFAPREIRQRGRGPCWEGPISANHASALLHKLQVAGHVVIIHYMRGGT